MAHFNNKDLHHEFRHSDTFTLRQITNKVENKEDISGFYFLIGGKFEGSKTSSVNIKVFAEVGGYYRVISFPIEKLRVKINNNLKKPTLQIGYYGSKLTNSEAALSPGVFIIQCPEKYLPEKLIP